MKNKYAHFISLSFIFFLFSNINFIYAQCDEATVDIVSDAEFRIIHFGETIDVLAIYDAPSNWQVTSIRWRYGNLDVLCDMPLCFEQSVLIEDTTDIRIDIAFENGCTLTHEVTVIPFRGKEVYIPNAFSPNGDGINDVFIIYGGPTVKKIISMEIFSRKGDKLFEFYNYPPNSHQYGWDGKNRGETSNQEVYAWKAAIEYMDGEVDFMMGDVLILR